MTTQNVNLNYHDPLDTHMEVSLNALKINEIVTRQRFFFSILKASLQIAILEGFAFLNLSKHSLNFCINGTGKRTQC